MVYLYITYMPHRMFSVGEWFAGSRQLHSLFFASKLSDLRIRLFV
jgi:hypothetical protein